MEINGRPIKEGHVWLDSEGCTQEIKFILHNCIRSVNKSGDSIYWHPNGDKHHGDERLVSRVPSLLEKFLKALSLSI